MHALRSYRLRTWTASQDCLLKKKRVNRFFNHSLLGRWFYGQLETFRISWMHAHCSIDISRKHLLSDSFNEFKKLSLRDLHKEVKFRFKGEPAEDAGGCMREWFTLIIENLCNPDLCLFRFSDVDTITYQINRASWINESHLEYFSFVGRTLGKAIFEKVVVDAVFCRPLLKQLIGVPVDLEDLAFADQQLYNSLIFMRHNKIEDILFETFSVTEERFGETMIIDLKPNGRNINVTDTNKEEFIKLTSYYQIYDSIKQQIQHLQRGLHEVIPLALLRVFDFQELELLINGLPNLDVEDWKKHTTYAGDFSATHPIVIWFWDVVENEFNAEERARLLQFATGTSRVPVEGFKSLESNRGQQSQFTLQPVEWSDVAPLPRAHTCFNRLDVPKYRSRRELLKYVSASIQMEITGFGME
eukprot:GHVL01031084.1.p1 GENE.GHVL01031084.1~~GHVL01031084.1.p1  ORF type:complete len:415 (+),score=40.77 GHVL01031084.1:378-1622(+)